MAKKEEQFAYRQVRVRKKDEVRMVGVLMRSGQRFSAVSETDYLISNKQCDQLTKMRVPYTKI